MLCKKELSMGNVHVVVAGGSHLDRILEREGNRVPLSNYLGGAAHAAYAIQSLYQGPPASLTTYLYDYPIKTFGSQDASLPRQHEVLHFTLGSYAVRRGVDQRARRLEHIYHRNTLFFDSTSPQFHCLRPEGTAVHFSGQERIQPDIHTSTILILMQNGSYFATDHSADPAPAYHLAVHNLLNDSPNSSFYIWAPILSSAPMRSSAPRVVTPPLDRPRFLDLYDPDRHQARSVLILTATDLRHLGLLFRGDKSLEYNAWVFFTHLDKLATHLKNKLPKHVILMFENIGALHFCTDDSQAATVSYCPFFDSPEEYYPDIYGRMRGYRTLMISGVVNSMIQALLPSGSQDVFHNLPYGIRDGVLLGKVHYHEGIPDNPEPIGVDSAHNLWLHPLAPSIHELLQTHPTHQAGSPNITPAASSSSATIYNSMVDSNDKRLLRKNQYKHLLAFASVAVTFDKQSGHVDNRVRHLEKRLEAITIPDYARSIVKYGLSQMAHLSITDAVKRIMHPELPHAQGDSICLPYATFGKLQTVDRNEIDGFRTMRALIERYAEDRLFRGRPLCIAVFGAPGSGKGFTIKQILKDVNTSKADSNALEINLSQLPDSDSLMEAFHDVQERELVEELPLVIFDEFDCNFPGAQSQPLGWLKFFLAPMQDGTFFRKGKIYHIGRAIFLFAGGVSHSYSEFFDSVTNADVGSPPIDGSVASKSGDSVKGIDFISRLRGHLNILPINPSRGESISNDLRVRRAIILRSMLEKEPARVINRVTKEARMDDKVIDAFLEANGFMHGVRSMEAIVEMATLYGNEFLVASLPPRNQLNMHVAEADFDGLALKEPEEG
jgi:hypothetical protein